MDEFDSHVRRTRALVLIALALVAYQLRRKHRSLRTQPFGL